MKKICILISFMFGILWFFYTNPSPVISQERPVSFEYVFSDSRLNFAFNLGRAYQLGRSDGVLRQPMSTRKERELMWGRLKGFLEKYIYNPTLLEELHKSYEAGYLDMIAGK